MLRNSPLLIFGQAKRNHRTFGFAMFPKLGKVTLDHKGPQFIKRCLASYLQ